MTATFRSLCLGLVGSAVLAAGCDAPGYPPFDRGQLLSEATTTLIVPSFRDASASATALSTATGTLCTSPSTEALTTAQTAWVAAASDWRAVAPFLVHGGPTLGTSTVTIQTVDSNLTYEASIDTIEAHVTGTDDLGAASYVASLGAQDKGFFALEYLLFAYPSFTARDATQTLAALGGARRCQYARAVAADIAMNVGASHDAWVAYAPLFSTGSGPSYSSTQAAVNDLIDAVAAAIDRTQDIHVGRPLGLTMHAGRVESPYAGASVALMQAALESADHTWSMTPHCLDAFLRSRNPMLADEILAELASSRAAVDQLASPPLSMPWEQYVASSDHTAGRAAYDRLTTLKAELLADVSSTLGHNVFLPSDGD